MSRQETSTPFVSTLPNDPTLDKAWTAVRNRNRRFDGCFFYAVTTTGIYCRPSCPSRKPRRENVVFFESSRDAEGAGFRACLRCRPDDRTRTEQAVEQARRYVDRHLDEKVTLDVLADETGLSPHHLQRSFKRLLGLSPKAYHNARRLEAFKNHVGDEKDVLEAAFEAGFGSSSALYEQSNAALGMTPATYRRGGEGVVIRYTIVPTAFGRMLVAATSRGVCAVSLGSSDAELVSELRREFPRAAEIARDDETIRQWAEPVVEYFGGKSMHPVVPLDLQGTDFQRSVWAALQKIPYGQTRSYGELAKMLGRPSAARAVAQACATNKAAVVVPCHRVIRGDGTISGYRWGKDRKRRLLDLEHQQPDP